MLLAASLLAHEDMNRYAECYTKFEQIGLMPTYGASERDYRGILMYRIF